MNDAEYHILNILREQQLLLREILHELRHDRRILRKIEGELLKPELQSSGATVKTIQG